MPRSHFARFIISISLFLPASGRAIAQCEVGWANQIQLEFPFHSILPGVVFDEDGDGPIPPCTVFSGWYDFTSPPSQALAAWDGTYWTGLPGANHINGNITAFAVIDTDGEGPLSPSLYIAGNFTSIGGVAANHLARYSAGVWYGTGDGVPEFPYGIPAKLIVLDEDGDGPSLPRLIARASVVAEITENTVIPLGDVDPITFSSTDLIVADLDGVGPAPPTLIRSGHRIGQLTREVQTWSGSTWERMGEAFDNSIWCLAVYDPDEAGPLAPELYAGGIFSTVGRQSIRSLARWKNGEWGPPAVPLLNTTVVNSLCAGDDDGDGPRRHSLFVAGNFLVPGAPESTGHNFGRWDGHSWEGIGYIYASPYSYRFRPAELSVHGQPLLHLFSQFGEFSRVRDSTGWRTTYQLSSSNIIARAMDLDGPGPQPPVIVAAASNLAPIDHGVAPTIATWNGGHWERLGSNDLRILMITDFTLFDFDGIGEMPPSLVVAGRFLFGTERYTSAALIGNLWTPMGPPNSGTGFTLAVYDSDHEGPESASLFLGGNFPQVNASGQADYLMRWSGELGWTPVESQLSSTVRVLHVQDDDGTGPIKPALYLSGPNFVNGIQVNGIARWDGVEWRPLVDVETGDAFPPGVISCLFSLEESPDRFTLCAGGASFRAARWRDGHWIPMGASLTHPLTAMIRSEPGVDGSSTASLLGLGSNRVFRWNGDDWELLAQKNTPINSLTSIDFDGAGPMSPQLVVAGGFGTLFESISPLTSFLTQNIDTWGQRQPFFRAAPWNRSVGVGSRLSLKVATGGQEPMTFAWTRDGVPMADGGAVSGATTRELIIDPVMMSDSGQYECIATNACGSIPSGPTLVRVCATLANGDVNADGHVDGLDIPPFIEMWTSPSTPAADCAVDLTHNGVRDPDDIAWFIGRLLSP